MTPRHLLRGRVSFPHYRPSRSTIGDAPRSAGALCAAVYLTAPWRRATDAAALRRPVSPLPALRTPPIPLATGMPRTPPRPAPPARRPSLAPPLRPRRPAGPPATNPRMRHGTRPDGCPPSPPPARSMLLRVGPARPASAGGPGRPLVRGALPRAWWGAGGRRAASLAPVGRRGAERSSPAAPSTRTVQL